MSWPSLQGPPLWLRDVPMIAPHLYLVCSQLGLLYVGQELPGYWRVMKYWGTFAFVPLYPMDGVTGRRLPSACPWHIVLRLHRRGLCSRSCHRCYRNGRSRRRCGFNTVPGTTVSWKMCALASVSQMRCVREGSSIPLRAYVHILKELGADFSLHISLWVVGQYRFLDGSFVKFICLWLMMKWHVGSLNKLHVYSQCERARPKWQ